MTDVDELRRLHAQRVADLEHALAIARARVADLETENTTTRRLLVKTATTRCRACGGLGWITDYSVPGRTQSACDGCHGAGVHRIA